MPEVNENTEVAVVTDADVVIAENQMFDQELVNRVLGMTAAEMKQFTIDTVSGVLNTKLCGVLALFEIDAFQQDGISYEMYMEDLREDETLPEGRTLPIGLCIKATDLTNGEEDHYLVTEHEDVEEVLGTITSARYGILICHAFVNMVKTSTLSSAQFEEEQEEESDN